eukprot:m51a1_g1376 hypothetical protein (1390) ;mRNA; r:435518-441159
MPASEVGDALEPRLMNPALKDIATWRFEAFTLPDEESGTYAGRSWFRNGATYTGEFRGGTMHGRGAYRWPDNVRYEGEFTYNTITGRGTMTWHDTQHPWPNGWQYTGEFVEGVRHGRGAITCSKAGLTYDGEWSQGQRSGTGTWTLQTSQGMWRYEGEWVRGQRNGKGSMHYPSGSFYKGNWTNGLKDGWGVMAWPSQQQVYAGEWNSGVQSGAGAHYYGADEPAVAAARSMAYSAAAARGADPVAPLHRRLNAYNGQWDNGERHGQGTFVYADGSRYSGMWAHGRKEGEGAMELDDGRCIAGEFAGDKPPPNAVPKDAPAIAAAAAAVGVQDIESFRSDYQALLQRHLSDLKRLYNAYSELGMPTPPGERGGPASSAAPATLSLASIASMPPTSVAARARHFMTTVQFGQLVRDIGAVCRVFPGTAANRVAAKVARGAAPAGVPCPFYDKPHAPRCVLLPHEFAAALAAVALESRRARARAGDAPPEDPVTPVCEAVGELLSTPSKQAPSAIAAEGVWEAARKEEESLSKVYEEAAHRPPKNLEQVTPGDLTITKSKSGVGIDAASRVWRDPDGVFSVEQELSYFDFIDGIAMCAASHWPQLKPADAFRQLAKDISAQPEAVVVVSVSPPLASPDPLSSSSGSVDSSKLHRRTPSRAVLAASRSLTELVPLQKSFGELLERPRVSSECLSDSKSLRSPRSPKLTPRSSTDRESAEVVASGWCIKQGRMIKTWRQRWFVLTSDHWLRYYSEPGGPQKGAVVVNPSASVTTETATVSHVEATVLRLSVTGRDLLFIPKDGQLGSWARALETMATGPGRSRSTTPKPPGGQPELSKRVVSVADAQPNEASALNVMLFRPAPEVLADVNSRKAKWCSLFVCGDIDELLRTIAQPWTVWKVVADLDLLADLERDVRHMLAQREASFEPPVVVEFSPAARYEAFLFKRVSGPAVYCPRLDFRKSVSNTESYASLFRSVCGPQAPVQQTIECFASAAPTRSSKTAKELKHRGLYAVAHGAPVATPEDPRERNHAVLSRLINQEARQPGTNDTALAIAGLSVAGCSMRLSYDELFNVAKYLKPSEGNFDRTRPADGCAELLKFWLHVFTRDASVPKAVHLSLSQAADEAAVRCWSHYIHGLFFLFQRTGGSGLRCLKDFAGKCFCVSDAAALPPVVARGSRICFPGFVSATRSRFIAEKWLHAGQFRVLFVMYTCPPAWDARLRNKADISSLSFTPNEGEVLFLPLSQWVVHSVLVPPAPGPDSPVTVFLLEDYDASLQVVRAWSAAQELADRSVSGTTSVVASEGGDLEVAHVEEGNTRTVSAAQTEEERRMCAERCEGNVNGTEREMLGKMQQHSQEIHDAIVRRRVADGRPPPASGLEATEEYAFCLIDPQAR